MKTWVDNELITAADLNNIESGIGTNCRERDLTSFVINRSNNVPIAIGNNTIPKWLVYEGSGEEEVPEYPELLVFNDYIKGYINYNGIHKLRFLPQIESDTRIETGIDLNFDLSNYSPVLSSNGYINVLDHLKIKGGQTLYITIADATIQLEWSEETGLYTAAFFLSSRYDGTVLLNPETKLLTMNVSKLDFRYESYYAIDSITLHAKSNLIETEIENSGNIKYKVITYIPFAVDNYDYILDLNVRYGGTYNTEANINRSPLHSKFKYYYEK